MDRNIGLRRYGSPRPRDGFRARDGARGRKLADQAAVDAMRKAFNDLHIRGTIVIGEGERDEAPMLFIGEKVGGRGEDPEVDIALDRWKARPSPHRRPNALSVIACGKGNLLNAPTRTWTSRGGPSAKAPSTWTKARRRTAAIADRKGVYVDDLT